MVSLRKADMLLNIVREDCDMLIDTSIDYCPFVYNDGGRAEAGWKGMVRVGDCVTRAIAIATGKPYQEVYDTINELALTERKSKRRRGTSTARNGVHRVTSDRYLMGLGWAWTPTMHIGSGCRVHLRRDELPTGRLIVSLSRHYTAVIDGVIHDRYDPSREGTRCVYGYWAQP
jgi:hypothetical protein